MSNIKVQNGHIYVNEEKVAKLLPHIREDDVREDIDTEWNMPRGNDVVTREEVEQHLDQIEAENAGAH